MKHRPAPSALNTEPLRGLDRLMGTNILFKCGEARSIGCDCTHEVRFYSKWLLWKPATPFWGFNLKHWYLIFKQAHLASFCFILTSEPKFWQLTAVFNAFYRLYLEITFFCNKPSGQIFVSRDRCQMLRLFSVISTRHYWSLITPSFRNFSLILSKVESSSWSQLVQK